MRMPSSTTHNSDTNEDDNDLHPLDNNTSSGSTINSQLNFQSALTQITLDSSSSTIARSANSNHINSRSVKRESADSSTGETHPLKKMLLAFNEKINLHLNAIETRIEDVETLCSNLESKLDRITSVVTENSTQVFINSNVSLNNDDNAKNIATTSTSLGNNNVTVITLNTESDYPDGCWLGDESNPELRVRCKITPTDLFHINATSTSAEKMALTLLDYLFDRETQAKSNISGCGKHKKVQLDPLIVFGIQCHLMYKFGLNYKMWTRIRQNLDSKCRTAFRRKQKGLPLSTVTKRLQMYNTSDSEDLNHQMMLGNPDFSNNSLSMPGNEEPTTSFATFMSESELIQTDQGLVQVVHATAEQLEQLQKMHNFQIVNSENLVSMMDQKSTSDDEEEYVDDKDLEDSPEFIDENDLKEESDDSQGVHIIKM